MSSSVLGSQVCYHGLSGSALWEGRFVRDAESFESFVRNVVFPRISDQESFEEHLRGLATTDLATEHLERVLRATPPVEDWEIGEALAECVLQQDSGREIHWPWNTVCDRRTPRASLPGADLVGFHCEEQSVFLLFGEVKTSSENVTPPSVMVGQDGMIAQLAANATRLEIHHTLLRWLYARCRSAPYEDMYRRAVQRYLASRGKELMIVGVLLRDTAPDERDLRNRAKVLAKQLPEPSRVQLLAWYLPVVASQWLHLLRRSP